MSQLLFDNIVVGARWETLLGLENEKNEIQQLAAETQAQHYVVIDNGMQTRSVGLTTIPKVAQAGSSFAANNLQPNALHIDSKPLLDDIEKPLAATKKLSWLQQLKLKPRAQAEPLAQNYYPLAALFCLHPGQPQKLFLHALPDSETHAIVIAVRDNRPVIDLVLPWLEAYQSAQQFFESCQKNIVLFGEAWPNPSFKNELERKTISIDFIRAQMEMKPLPLMELVKLSKSSNGEVLIFTLIRQPLPIQKIALAALVVLGSCIVLYSIYALYAWLTKPAPIVIPPPADLATVFRKEQQMALEKEALHAGLSYARQVYQRLTPLPVNARGWHPSKIVCEKNSCLLNWERGGGGTFNSVLELRNNAVVESMNEAKEVIELSSYTDTGNKANETASLPAGRVEKAPAAAAMAVTATQESTGLNPTQHPQAHAATSSKSRREVHPISAEQFYRTAGARLQTLKDFQMDVTIELPQPLVPFPEALAGQKDQIKPISKGTWKLQGKLGFLDSVPGLLGYAPNVTLERLEIIVDPSNPTFNAQGGFYVE